MKRVFVFLLSAILLFSSVLAESATATLQELYAQAELLMVQGDYAGASAKFESLGAYSDASQMAMYCKAIYVAESLGMYSITVDALNDLGDFKDSKQLAVYYQGRSLEAAGAGIDLSNIASVPDADLIQAGEFYDAARDIYAELALFKDCLTRMVACDSALEAIRTEQEVRKSANQETKYQKAVFLHENGQYAEALELFMELGAYKDAVERGFLCEEMIMDNQYQAAYALESQGYYAEAIVMYNAFNGYRDSADRAAYCENHIGYEDIRSFSEGLAAVKKNGKWGFIDTKGTLVIPFTDQYTPVGSFSNGLVLVAAKNGKYGFLNTDGVVEIACVYQYAKTFSEGMAAVQPSGSEKWGYIDTNGNMVIAAEHYNAQPFSDGVAGTSLGFINRKGNIVLNYDGATSQFSEGLAPITKRKGKTTTIEYIDKTGKTTFTSTYDFAYGFHEGFAAVRKNNKWGFIDKTGKLVISLQYDHATDWHGSQGFSSGYVCVQKDGKYGLIDTNANLILPFEYDAKMEFSEGYILVLKDGVIHIMNQDFETVY